MKIYLANSITQASPEYKQQMLDLREKLKANYEMLEYFGVAGGSAKDVYEHDINCVKQADLILAEVSYPSTGLGIEITTALYLGKKVLAIAKNEALVTRMVLGLEHPNFKFIRYSDLAEILKINLNEI